jgi:hypothetical protein
VRRLAKIEQTFQCHGYLSKKNMKDFQGSERIDALSEIPIEHSIPGESTRVTAEGGRRCTYDTFGAENMWACDESVVSRRIRRRVSELQT